MLRIVLSLIALLPGTLLAQETALENGSPVTVPNTPGGGVRSYYLDVAADMTTLDVVLTGGTGGDADLYVNFDTPSSDFNADCHSTDLGNEEQCTIASPTPGRWYVQVHGASAFGGGVQLLALAAVALQDDVARSISGVQGSENWYFIQVPGGQGHLTVTTSAGSGNPNMHVGTDLFAAPECGSGSADTTDSCEIDQPSAGPWLVKITGTEAYSGVTLKAEYGVERASSPPEAGALPPASIGGLMLLLLSRSRQRRGATLRYDRAR